MGISSDKLEVSDEVLETIIEEYTREAGVRGLRKRIDSLCRGAAVLISKGGLPEKLMAALRSGVKTAFIPYENEQDLVDVADEVKENLQIIPVKTVEEVLKRTGVIE